MPIPPGSVLSPSGPPTCTVEAFLYGAGWELSPASTAASPFKTPAASCHLHRRLLPSSAPRVAARWRVIRPASRPVHPVATDGEVEAALQEAAQAGGTVVKRAAPTPLGGSYGFFADPDGHVWEVIHHPLYQLGTDGRPEVP